MRPRTNSITSIMLTCIQRACRSCIDWRYESTCREGDVMTDMPLALYPQGLYDVRPCVHGWAPGCAVQARARWCSIQYQAL